MEMQSNKFSKNPYFCLVSHLGSGIIWNIKTKIAMSRETSLEPEYQSESTKT